MSVHAKKPKSAVPFDHMLCLDPGTREAGVAHFYKRKLVAAWLLKASGADDVVTRLRDLAEQAIPVGEAMLGLRYQLIIEDPVIRTAGPNRTRRPADILKLAKSIGAIVVPLPTPGRIDEIPPEEWKGQTGADMMTQWILKQMTPEEREVTAPLKHNHNVVDSVGMGLWASMRLR